MTATSVSKNGYPAREVPPDDPLPVGWEMPLIHRIFRHGFAELSRLVGDVPPEATGRARAVADHLAFTLDGLHAHHSTEDELLWPLLHMRAPAAAATMARLEGQHAALAAGMDEVRRAAEAWARQPSAPASVKVGASVRALLADVVAHLDEEEREILPLIAQHITADEWESFGQRAFEKFRPWQRPIAMGQLLEVASPHESARMFATLPVPVRVMWRLAGRRLYRRTMDRVRGKTPRLMQAAMRAAKPLGVRLYERSDGRRGGTAKSLPVLLLTVTGRRTGTPRTTPVAYLHHDGNYLIAGSGGGMAQEPQWFRNLRHADWAAIRTGADTHEVTVRIPDRSERDHLWNDVVLVKAPFFAKYQRKSARLIPLAVLTQIGEDVGTRRLASQP